MIVLVAAVHIVSGVPTGAPRAACMSLAPQHGSNAPQTTLSPHIVDLSDFNVTLDEDTGEIVSIYYNPDVMYTSELNCVENNSITALTVSIIFSHSGGDRRGNVLGYIQRLSPTRQSLCR